MSYGGHILPTRSDLKIDAEVIVVTSDGRKVIGHIAEILTNVNSHFQGIKVKLSNNEVGRVHSILSEKTENQILSELVKEFRDNLFLTESQTLEFKASFLFNYNRFLVDKSIKPFDEGPHTIGKTIAAFANQDGGTLYIGVNDVERNILGLENDYSLLDGDLANKKNSDGFMLKLKRKMVQLMNEASFNQCIRLIRILPVDNKEICVIKVRPTDTPVILNNEELFVRDNDSSNKYNILNFCQHWCRHLKTYDA